MSTISIRDYEQRLAALAITQPTPQAFDQALGLAKGLLSALRSWGTPPVTQPSLKIRAQSLKPRIEERPDTRPAHLVRPATKPPIPSTWPNAKAEQRNYLADPAQKAARYAAPPSPEGYMSSKEMLAELERTEAWLDAALNADRFPRAELRQGIRNYWLRSTVMAWKAANPSTPPDGYLSTAQVLRAIDRSESWFSKALKSGDFPHAMLVVRSRNYWMCEVVEQWKAANPHRKAVGRPRTGPTGPIDKNPGDQPAGTLTLKQITTLCDRTQPWVYQQMELGHGGRKPFPRPLPDLWGRYRLWNEAEVRAWMAWRSTQTDPRIATKPLGTA